jgi:hypothetical protein
MIINEWLIMINIFLILKILFFDKLILKILSQHKLNLNNLFKSYTKYNEWSFNEIHELLACLFISSGQKLSSIFVEIMGW